MTGAIDDGRAEPVHLAEQQSRLGQGVARADDDAPPPRVDPQHIEGLVGGDAEPLALSDGKARDALVAAEDAAAAVDDVAGLACLGPQPLDEAAVRPVRDKADVLAVGLVGDRQSETRAPRRGSRPW